jgi:hypothetical protein
MDDFWPAWLSFWIPTIIALVGALIALPQSSTVQYLEAPPVERTAAKAVYLSYNLISAVFGKKLFSWRAVGASIVLSVLAFVFALAIACATTKFLWTDFQTIAGGIFHAGSKSNFQSRFGRVSDIFGLGVVVLSLAAEYLYVTKSRLILRSLRFESGYMTLATKVAFDIVTTFLLFSLIAPLPIIISVVALGTIFPQVDIQHVDILGHAQFAGKYSPAQLEQLNAENPISAYIALVNVFWTVIFAHIREGFAMYHFVDAYPTIQDKTTVIRVVNGFAYLNHHVVTLGFMYPFTTMLASAFATTAWVALSSGLLLFSKFLCHTFAMARSTLENLHRHPHLIFWWGIFPSIAIFLVGSLVHEALGLF